MPLKGVTGCPYGRPVFVCRAPATTWCEMTLPTAITAGDTLAVAVDAGVYTAAAGWAATLRLTPRSAGTVRTVSGVAAADQWTFTADATTTAAWAAGAYTASIFVSKASDRHTLEAAQVTVAADPGAIAAGTDTRTLAAKALDDLKAALAAWTPTRKSYQIGDVAMTFNSSADIVQMIEFWSRQVQGEQTAAALAGGRLNPNKIYVRSGRA